MTNAGFFDEGGQLWTSPDGRAWPAIYTSPQRTAAGTPYMLGPGVALIGRTMTCLDAAGPALVDLDQAFDAYLDDPTDLGPGEQLAKFAGQLCYLSFGPGATRNAEAGRYFDNIRAQGHGSVLEHATYSFLWYGLSRSMTHEQVRHRLASYSQVSQRYVGGAHLRFVERPEYRDDEELHARFVAKIDRDRAYYEESCDLLLRRQEAGYEALAADKKTEARKRVRQCARESLPNCTEAPMVVTANARSWRHILDMRASPAAEVEIRRLAYLTYLCLTQVDALLWSDFASSVLPDGTSVLSTPTRRV